MVPGVAGEAGEAASGLARRLRGATRFEFSVCVARRAPATLKERCPIREKAQPMKTTLFVAVVTGIALLPVGRVPAQDQNQPGKDAEKLPEFPKLNPKNAVVALNPEKTIFGEVTGEEKDKKVVRVGLAAEVYLREGPLEIFLCKKGTKEHEAIVRVDADTRFVHLALEAAGAVPGKPTQFINPKTEEAEWKAATGTKINVLVHYTKGGKTFTHPAQEWIWDVKKKAPLAHGWVFAGSVLIVNPDNPEQKFYGANSGDVISISNFPYSMLEIPAEISKDDANLIYEAKTEKIPPLFSKVWVILEPVPAKK